MSENLSGELKTNEYTIIHHSREFFKIFNELDHPIHVEIGNDGEFDTLIKIRPCSEPMTEVEK